MRHFELFLLAAFLGGFFCTFVSRQLALRTGFVNIPSAQRWSRRTVALGGGMGFLLPGLLIGSWLAPDFAALAFGALCAGVVGMWDDLRPLRPLSKFLFQLVLAHFLFFCGFRFHFQPALLAYAFTIFWFVGINNAVNLLDNMDGASAGTVILIFLFATLGAPVGSLQLFLLPCAAALAGFLVWNFPPAKIYMGDSGALSLGTLVAAALTRLPFESRLPEFCSVVQAALIAGVPILDTSLVVLARRLYGRQVSAGGKDHLSHRLADLGLRERSAITVLYLLTALSATVGRLSFSLDPEFAVAFVALIFNVYLLALWFLIRLDHDYIPGGAAGRARYLGSDAGA